MAKKTSEIKLIENNTECHYRVTVNGVDAYTPFPFTGDPDNQTEARRAAKAAAFDEVLRELHHGNAINVSYLSH